MDKKMVKTGIKKMIKKINTIFKNQKSNIY